MDNHSASLVSISWITSQVWWTVMLCSPHPMYHGSWYTYEFHTLTQPNGFVGCLSCVRYWGKKANKVNMELFLSPRSFILLCGGHRSQSRTSPDVTGSLRAQMWWHPSTLQPSLHSPVSHYSPCHPSCENLVFLTHSLYGGVVLWVACSEFFSSTGNTWNWIIYVHFLGQFILTYVMYLLIEKTHAAYECGAMKCFLCK